MIVIKSIEVIEVPGDILDYYPQRQMVAAFDAKSCRPYEKMLKRVEGRRFVNARGEEFCIGWAEEVEEAVGLPFEIFENMSKDLEEFRMESINQVGQINRYQKYISELGRAGFFKRLKNLFTGYTYG